MAMIRCADRPHFIAPRKAGRRFLLTAKESRAPARLRSSNEETVPPHAPGRTTTIIPPVRPRTSGDETQRANHAAAVRYWPIVRRWGQGQREKMVLDFGRLAARRQAREPFGDGLEESCDLIMVGLVQVGSSLQSNQSLSDLS